MRYLLKRQWHDGVAWLTTRPRGSAMAATILLLMIAALIRPPVIEGSMIDQISGTNEQLEISRRIQAATGGMTTAAVIVRAANVSIDRVFLDIAALRDALVSIDPAIELRSIDASRDQLFVYGLSGRDSVLQLLEVLADNPESAPLISNDVAAFLLALSFAESFEQGVLDTLDAHDWDRVYTQHHLLSGAQLENDIAAALSRDLQLLIPVIVITMLVALYLAFGRWRALLLPVFASVASTVVTFALFSVAGVTVNLVTLLGLPIVLIVGLANSCHFLARAGTALEETDDVGAATVATLRRVGPPFFFSSLTTSIALVSLGLNDIPPIADLGRLAGAALLLVFVLVMLAAPLSLRWYLQGYSRRWQKSRLLAGLSRVLVAWRVQISVALVAILLAGGAATPMLSINSDPRAFFPDGAPFSAAMKRFEQDFYLFAPLRILVAVDRPTDDPAFALRQAGALRAAIAGRDDVRQVRMSAAVSSQSQFVLTALLAREDALPAVTAALEQQLVLLPAGVEVVYSSAPMVYNDIDRQATDSLLQSLVWSVLLIFGAILLVFRSWRGVVSTMLANAVPLMLVCGAVWLIGKPLNLVTMFVFLVALGVIVDDAIHILFSRVAGDPIAGSSIEFSVLLSTAMLCLGLLLCQLSDFPTTREFAAYCALALVGAVVSNLTLLPLALRWPRERARTE